jgi:hypothetical protein
MNKDISKFLNDLRSKIYEISTNLSDHEDIKAAWSLGSMYEIVRVEALKYKDEDEYCLDCKNETIACTCKGENE